MIVRFGATDLDGTARFRAGSTTADEALALAVLAARAHAPRALAAFLATVVRAVVAGAAVLRVAPLPLPARDEADVARCFRFGPPRVEGLAPKMS